MTAGRRAWAPLIAVLVGGALITGLLWVWPFSSFREGRSAEVQAAVQAAESLDARITARREAAAVADSVAAAEHRRFSEALDAHLLSVLDGGALIAWTEYQGSGAETPLAFLSAPEALWRAETQVAATLLGEFTGGIAEASVSDPQRVEGLDGLVVSVVDFRVDVASLEDVIALVLALDSRPDVILDEVKTGVDDGPQGTGRWSAELTLRWYRLPDTLEPQ